MKANPSVLSQLRSGQITLAEALELLVNSDRQVSLHLIDTDLVKRFTDSVRRFLRKNAYLPPVVPLLLWRNCYYLGSPIGLSDSEIVDLKVMLKTDVSIIPIGEQSYRNWFRCFDVKEILANLDPVYLSILNQVEREQDTIDHDTNRETIDSSDSVEERNTNQYFQIEISQTQCELQVGAIVSSELFQELQTNNLEINENDVIDGLSLNNPVNQESIDANKLGELTRNTTENTSLDEYFQIEISQTQCELQVGAIVSSELFQELQANNLEINENDVIDGLSLNNPVNQESIDANKLGELTRNTAENTSLDEYFQIEISQTQCELQVGAIVSSELFQELQANNLEDQTEENLENPEIFLESSIVPTTYTNNFAPYVTEEATDLIPNDNQNLKQQIETFTNPDHPLFTNPEPTDPDFFVDFEDSQIQAIFNDLIKSSDEETIENITIDFNILLEDVVYKIHTRYDKATRTRMKKLLQAVCTGHWITRNEELNGVTFSDLIDKTLQMYPKKATLEACLRIIVRNLNKTEIYENVVEQLLDRLQEVYYLQEWNQVLTDARSHPELKQL